MFRRQSVQTLLHAGRSDPRLHPYGRGGGRSQCPMGAESGSELNQRRPEMPSGEDASIVAPGSPGISEKLRPNTEQGAHAYHDIARRRTGALSADYRHLNPADGGGQLKKGRLQEAPAAAESWSRLSVHGLKETTLETSPSWIVSRIRELRRFAPLLTDVARARAAVRHCSLNIRRGVSMRNVSISAFLNPDSRSLGTANVNMKA